MINHLVPFKKMLAQAFPEEPVPTRVVDSSNLYEPAKANKMLFGKKWSQLNLAELQSSWQDISICGALPFLTSEAFKYYLPFFMLTSISGVNEQNTADIEMLMRMLGGDHSEAETPNYIRRNISSFSPAQTQVIGEFVRIASKLYENSIPTNEFKNLFLRYA